jgi:hypothetical protein
VTLPWRLESSQVGSQSSQSNSENFFLSEAVKLCALWVQGRAPCRRCCVPADVMAYAWQLLRDSKEADYKMILIERRAWLAKVRE